MQVNNVQNNNYTNFGARIRLTKSVEQLVHHDVENNMQGASELKSALKKLSEVGGDTILDLTLTHPSEKELLTGAGNRIILDNPINGCRIYSKENHYGLVRSDIHHKSTFVDLIEEVINSTEFWNTKPNNHIKTVNEILTYFA